MIVVGGLALDEHGRALMGFRPAEKLRPLMWEYPGGKVEAGEARPAALEREWMEELGVTVRVGKMIAHAAFEVEEPIEWSLYFVMLGGIPVAKAHDAIRWVKPLDAIRDLPCTPTTYLCFGEVQRFIAQWWGAA